ncbi:MAG: hypothetical protein E6G00_04030 [Actinobacteria bacterium]|nr:MAG: hypothetical protein E6G00_04030 [Actinomycetota bacterium]
MTHRVVSGYRGAVAGLAVVLVAAIGVATGGSAQGGVVLDPTSITIYHDRHGVPQIEAGSADALAYGTGYEQAKERPFLTNGIRLFAQGRISELEGKDVLPADEAVRRDFYDAADVQRQYNLLPAGIKRELQAFSDGFNKGMQEVMLDPTRRPVLFDALGYSPEPWKPTDSVSVVMLFTYVEFAGEGGAGQLGNAALLGHLQRHFGNERGLAIWNDLLFKNDPRAPTVGGGQANKAPRSILHEKLPDAAQRRPAAPGAAVRRSPTVDRDRAQHPGRRAARDRQAAAAAEDRLVRVGNQREADAQRRGHRARLAAGGAQRAVDLLAARPARAGLELHRLHGARAWAVDGHRVVQRPRLDADRRQHRRAGRQLHRAHRPEEPAALPLPRALAPDDAPDRDVQGREVRAADLQGGGTAEHRTRDVRVHGARPGGGARHQARHRDHAAAGAARHLGGHPSRPRRLERHERAARFRQGGQPGHRQLQHALRRRRRPHDVPLHRRAADPGAGHRPPPPQPRHRWRRVARAAAGTRDAAGGRPALRRPVGQPGDRDEAGAVVAEQLGDRRGPGVPRGREPHTARAAEEPRRGRHAPRQPAPDPESRPDHAGLRERVAPRARARSERAAASRLEAIPPLGRRRLSTRRPQPRREVRQPGARDLRRGRHLVLGPARLRVPAHALAPAPFAGVRGRARRRGPAGHVARPSVGAEDRPRRSDRAARAGARLRPASGDAAARGRRGVDPGEPAQGARGPSREVRDLRHVEVARSGADALVPRARRGRGARIHGLRPRHLQPDRGSARGRRPVRPSAGQRGGRRRGRDHPGRGRDVPEALHRPDPAVSGLQLPHDAARRRAVPGESRVDDPAHLHGAVIA